MGPAGQGRAVICGVLCIIIWSVIYDVICIVVWAEQHVAVAEGVAAGVWAHMAALSRCLAARIILLGQQSGCHSRMMPCFSCGGCDQVGSSMTHQHGRCVQGDGMISDRACDDQLSMMILPDWLS